MRYRWYFLSGGRWEGARPEARGEVLGMLLGKMSARHEAQQALHPSTPRGGRGWGVWVWVGHEFLPKPQQHLDGAVVCGKSLATAQDGDTAGHHWRGNSGIKLQESLHFSFF